MAKTIFTPQARMKSEQPKLVLKDVITMYLKEFRHMYLPNNYEYIIK